MVGNEASRSKLLSQPAASPFLSDFWLHFASHFGTSNREKGSDKLIKHRAANSIKLLWPSGGLWGRFGFDVGVFFEQVRMRFSSLGASFGNTALRAIKSKENNWLIVVWEMVLTLPSLGIGTWPCPTDILIIPTRSCAPFVKVSSLAVCS